MSDNMAKSCRLSHTIIISNIKSLPCTKLEKIEFAQKLPGHAQILEGSILREPIFSGPEIFRNGSSHYFLQLLKFSAKSNNFFSNLDDFFIVQKPHFGPNLGQNLGQDIFFFENRASSLLIVYKGLT